MTDVGFVLKDMGQYAEAQPYFERALKTNRGDRTASKALKRPLASTTWAGLQGPGPVSRGTALLRAGIDDQTGDHGERHPGTVDSLNSLGFTFLDQWLHANWHGRANQELHARGAALPRTGTEDQSARCTASKAAKRR